MVKKEILDTQIETAMKIVYTPQEAVDLTVSGGTSPSNTSPPLDVRGARSLALQVIHNLTGSNSTDLDVIVYSSIDGSTFDTEPYASMNIGANKVKTIPITAGINYLKVKVQNNDASNATKVTTKLAVSR